MSSASRAKLRSTRFLTCSGSRDSDNDVNPTMSPKRTVTTRRSSVGTCSGWPHEGQKRASAGTSAEHDGQDTGAAYGHDLRVSERSRAISRWCRAARAPRLSDAAERGAPVSATSTTIVAARTENASKVYG